MIRVINAVVAEIAETEPEKLKPQNTLEELGFDSLAVIETAEGIEEELPVVFNDEDLADIRSLGDLYDMVWERLQRKSS